MTAPKRTAHTIVNNILAKPAQLPVVCSRRYGYPLGFMAGMLTGGFIGVAVDWDAACWVDLADMLVAAETDQRS